MSELPILPKRIRISSYTNRVVSDGYSHLNERKRVGLIELIYLLFQMKFLIESTEKI